MRKSPYLLACTLWLSGPAHAVQSDEVNCLRDLREAARLIDERWSFKLFKPGQIDLDAARSELEAEAREARTPSACADVLSRFIAQLNDGHSRLRYYPGLRYTGPGITVRSHREELTQVPGQRPQVHAYVFSRDTTEEGLSAIPIGSEILAVDGIPTDSMYRYLERRVSGSTPQWRDHMCDRQLLRGPENTDVQLSIREPNGSRKTLTVHRQTVRSQLIRQAGAVSDVVRIAQWRRLNGEWGYLKYTSFGFGTLENTTQVFDEALDSLLTTRGLIIDLRGNGGGYVDAIALTAGRFVDERTTIGFFQIREPRQDVIREVFDSTTMSTTTRPRLLAKPRGATYQGPVVILIDRGCFSACESFAGGLQSIKRALIVGNDASGGGSGFARGLRLSSGATISFSWTVAWRPDGQQIEGNGVAPNIRVKEGPDDWTAGRDPVLERAVLALERGEAYFPPN